MNEYNTIKNSLLILSILTLASCGGGGGGSSGGDTMSISAKIDSSYTVSATPSFLDYVQDALFGKRAMAISSGTFVNKVVAIPTYQGEYGPSMLGIMKSVDIASDGSFDLSLAKSYEWVLLLVDSTATDKNDKVVGYVAAQVDTDNNLIAFSGASLASGIDLGDLSKSGNEAVSSRSGSANAASFSLSLDGLKATAKADGGYKHLINLYLNYDATSGDSYLPQLEYEFSAGTVSNAADKDPTSATIEAYSPEGFDISIETNVISASLKDGICGTSIPVELVPPATLNNVTNTLTWTNTSGFKNDGVAPGCSDTGCNNLGSGNSANWLQSSGSEQRYYCYDADFGAQISTDYSNALIQFGFNKIQLPTIGMPAGMWAYKVNNIEVASFDLGVASPVNASGKLDATPVPAIRINTGINGQITGLVVKWFQYNAGTNQYDELTTDELAAIEILVKDTFLDVVDDDGTTISSGAIHLNGNSDPGFYDNGLHDGSSLVFPSAPADAWYIPGSIGASQPQNLVAQQIVLGLTMGGSLYNFGWEN